MKTLILATALALAAEPPPTELDTAIEVMARAFEATMSCSNVLAVIKSE